MGRPSSYTPEIADEICKRLSCSDLGLKRVAEELELNPDTVYGWLTRNKEFSEKYACAREAQQDYLADQILEIADDGTNDYVQRERNGKDVTELDSEHIQRSRLRVDARKWLMSKLAPKKYGDKVAVEQSGPDGGPIPVTLEIDL